MKPQRDDNILCSCDIAFSIRVMFRSKIIFTPNQIDNYRKIRLGSLFWEHLHNKLHVKKFLPFNLNGMESGLVFLILHL